MVKYKPIQKSSPGTDYPLFTKEQMEAYLSDTHLKKLYRFEENEIPTQEPTRAEVVQNQEAPIGDAPSEDKSNDESKGKTTNSNKSKK